MSPFTLFSILSHWTVAEFTSHFLLVLPIMLHHCGHITICGAPPGGQAQWWTFTAATPEFPLQPQVVVLLLSFLLHKEVQGSSVTCVAFTVA